MANSETSKLMKQVQELAMDEKEPPLRFVHKDGPSQATSFSSVPLVDLHRIFSASGSTEEKEEMEKLRSALASWGMFQAINHEMSNSLLDEVRNVTKEFFDLPMEQKQRYSVQPDDDREGYGNDKIICEEQILDWSDRLHLAVTPQDQRKLKFWPENPKRFREVLDEYSIKTRMLAESIIKTIGKVVGLEEDFFFRQFGEEAPTHVRFNYYPPCSKPNLVYGLKPHNDVGGITIVLQDKEVEGLQVVKDGEWIKVPVLPYGLVVNIADLMEVMSNGMFKSPSHRVVPDLEKERISLATFYWPQPENEIGPLDGLTNDAMPRLYKKVKVEDYFTMSFKKFLQGKRGIDEVKI